MNKLPDLIYSQPLGVLCTSDENCNPSGATLFYVVKDDKLYSVTHEDSLKVKHIRNNPNVCLVVSNTVDYQQAQLYATAKIVEKPQDYLPLIEDAIAEYSKKTNDFIPYMHITTEGLAPVVIELTPKRNKSYRPSEGLVEQDLS